MRYAQIVQNEKRDDTRHELMEARMRLREESRDEAVRAATMATIRYLAAMGFLVDGVEIDLDDIHKPATIHALDGGKMN